MERIRLVAGPMMAWSWGSLLLAACVGATCLAGDKPAGRGLTPAIANGGSDNAAVSAASSPAEPADGAEIVVPAHRPWMDTGVPLAAGQTVTIRARGRIVVERRGEGGRRRSTVVGPNGTYLYGDDVLQATFPLPCAEAGPAPPFCLIGRIGNGPPFYVGEARSWTATDAGPLLLGINDGHLSDNLGQFYARVCLSASERPVAFERSLPLEAEPGLPATGCRVVVFYVDGLRPDVVREMAAMGHLPNINRVFLQGGVWLSKTFTVFPSDTITSNGTMWSGCFSDRHGLKGQVRFSRRTLHSESYLETLGPHRSAQVLSRQGLDKGLHEAGGVAMHAIAGREAGRHWQAAATTDVPPIYQYLRRDGSDWATGVLPMMTDVPPLLWTRSMVRHLPYFRAQDAWQYVDDANTDFARWHLLAQNRPVTIIWLPETDSVSHKRSRGQFGLTRRTIARADELIGQVTGDLKARGQLRNTYLMLVSDHGHHGGKERHLTHFDVANELFHRPREVSPDGEWISGGLGLSVRQHRFWNRHSDDSSREFVFIDGDSDGVSRIFLPRKHFRSGRWMGQCRPADLLAYRIADHLPPVNLVKALTAVKAVNGEGRVEHPVDLVLLKLSDNAILIATEDRGEAVIHRKRSESGSWHYKYSPVTDTQPTADGQIAFREVEFAPVDPLCLLKHLYARQLVYYHDERSWLRMTADSQYPDGVVALTRHMLWQESIKDREAEYAPDLVVTARSGWYFGTKASPGTMHGYPLPDSMSATLFLAGPNVHRGARIDEPCRLVDLTPTLLEMVGSPGNADAFDGQPLRTIYTSASGNGSSGAGGQAQRQAVYWRDVDLNAWKSIQYAPAKQYEHLPVSVNRPWSALDLNNIAYNLLTISDLSLWRLLDDVLFPLADEDSGVRAVVERTDRNVRGSKLPAVGGAVQAVDVAGVTLGDYSLTSLGNLKRADRSIDWAQQQSRGADRRLAAVVGASSLPATSLVHATIDGAQGGFWEAYRFLQRVFVQLLDETVLNRIEDGTDQVLNRYRQLPAEVTVGTIPQTDVPAEPGPSEGTESDAIRHPTAVRDRRSPTR